MNVIEDTKGRGDLGRDDFGHVHYTLPNLDAHVLEISERARCVVEDDSVLGSGYRTILEGGDFGLLLLHRRDEIRRQASVVQEVVAGVRVLGNEIRKDSGHLLGDEAGVLRARGAFAVPVEEDGIEREDTGECGRACHAGNVLL